MIHENTFAITVPNWCRIGFYIRWYNPDCTGVNDWVREKIIGYGYNGFFHQASNCPLYFTEFSEYGKTVILEDEYE